VEAALPEVRTFDASRIWELPGRKAFDVPVTEESGRRRHMYREESRRREAFTASDQDYDAFLSSCNLRLILGGLNEGNRERVMELVQRTNQLNFSGNRYSREALGRLVAGDQTVPVVMSCEDRYGDYGIVGFAMLRVGGDAVEIMDMMFSCRIQAKKVEHGFLAHVAGATVRCGLAKLVCVYRRTSRNTPAAKVFEELAFRRDAAGGSEGAETCWVPAEELAGTTLPVEVQDTMDLEASIAGAMGGGEGSKV
jgi:FkbH-like protein